MANVNSIGEIGLNVSFTGPDQKNQENHTASVKTSDIKNEKSEITMAITQIGFWVMMFLYNPRTINYSVLLSSFSLSPSVLK